MTKEDLRYWDAIGTDYGDRFAAVWPNGDLVTMDANPAGPQGICLHGSGAAYRPICWIGIDGLYSYLGKMITFDDLPRDCQEVIEKELNEEDIT